jgi:hypothetical protein
MLLPKLIAIYQFHNLGLHAAFIGYLLDTRISLAALSLYT